MNHPTVTGDWKIDSKLDILNIIVNNNFECGGGDYFTAVKACEEACILARESTEISEDKKQDFIEDMLVIQEKIIIEWALFVQRGKETMQDVVKRLLHE